MKPLLITAIFLLFINLFLAGCDSKKSTTGDQRDGPVFGLYKHNSSNNITVKLNDDSTAVLDLNKTSIQKKAGIGAVHKEGTFTCRNDSIIITWENGGEVKSKFEKKNDSYGFRIGSTRYERNL
jgi:hypothetical protein